MVSTKFEGLNIEIPRSPDLATLYGEFERPWPLQRRATLPAYERLSGEAQEKQELSSDPSSNNAKGGEGHKKRPQSAPSALSFCHSSKDYHRALREIRKNEARDRRMNQRSMAEATHMGNRSSPAQGRVPFSVQLQGEKMETIPLGEEAPRTEGLWDSTTTILSRSGPALPPQPAPNGGLFAWLQVIAAFFVAFNCWGLPLAFGVLEPYYRSSLAPRTIPQIAWIGSTQLALPFFSAPFFNIVCDNQPRFFRVFFHGGTAFLIASILGTSWFETFAAIYGAQGIVAGTALGMLCCVYVKALRSWFDKKLELVMAISVVGATAGGICYSLAIAHLLYRIGYAWTFRALTLIIVTTMIFPTIIMRPRRSEQKKEVTTIISKRDILDVSYLLMLVGMFLSFLVLYFPYFYASSPSLTITSYAATALSLSPDPTKTVNFLLTMLAASLPGRILPAFLAEHIAGPLTLLIPSALLSANFAYLFIGAETTSTICLLAGVYGFASAAVLALHTPTSLAFAHKQPTEDFVLVSHRGDEGRRVEATSPMRTTVVLLTIGAAVIGGGPIGGRLLEMGAERRGGGPEMFVWAFVWVGSCLAGAAACFAGSRVAKVGWRGGKI